MLIVDIAARHFIYLIYIDTGETDCLPTNYEKTPQKNIFRHVEKNRRIVAYSMHERV